MCAYRVIGAKNISGREIGGSRRGAYLCVYVCDCCVNQSLRSEVPTFKGRKMGQKISRQIKAKVASRRVRKSRGSKSPETKEEERQETAMARDCVIEIESESKEIKEEEVLVVDPLTTSEECCWEWRGP